MKIFDRYSLLCISVAVILLMTLFVGGDDPGDDNEDMAGIVYDIRTSQNGYTFSFDDSNGGTIRCFTRTKPVEFEPYIIKGSFSDDRSMLFVSSMRPLGENGF